MLHKQFVVLLIPAILFAAGCSSSGGSNSTKPDDPKVVIPVNPIEGEAENPVEQDKGYKVIDGVVYFDGEVLGTIETDMYGKQSVVDADGNTLARITTSGQGYYIYIEHAGSGMYKDTYHIVQQDGKWTIDWANSVVDHGMGVDPDSVVKPEPMSVDKNDINAKKQHLRDSIKAIKTKR